MNKLGILLKVQLTGILGINRVLHSGDKKEKIKLLRFAVLMAVVFVTLLFSLVLYDFAFADAFNKIGLPQLMPALMMAAASLVTLFTTIYKVNGMLIGFRDYDMTMAMPIRTPVIVASRLLLVYLMNLGFCLFITVPAGIVYAYFAAPGPLFYLYMPLLALFVPMVPILIGTGIGLLVAAASSRFRHSNIVNIILTLVMILAAMASSFAFPVVITNPAAVSRVLMNGVYRVYPLTKMYTAALCEGNFLSLLLFIVISLVLFAVFAVALGRFFKYLNTAFTTSRTRSNYRMTTLRASPVLDALYRRELRRYFSSALYVLNTGIGMVLALIMCVALLFFKPAQLEAILEMPGFASVIGTLAPMVLAVLVCMSCTTGCSVSIEGKSFWIIKSLPVRAEMIFLSKIMVNLTVTIPLSLICALFLAVALPMSPAQILFLFLTPAVFAVLSAEAGLLLNLLHPNFTWTNEAVVIKQSMPSVLSILGGMIVSVAFTVGLAMLPPYLKTAGLAALTLLIAAADVLLYRLLKTKGAGLFQRL